MTEEDSGHPRGDIVRLMATDLEGDQQSIHALQAIKGVSHSFARVLCREAGINPKKKASDLSQDELDTLEEVIRNPGDYNIPSYMRNVRKDLETGDDLHLTGSELDVHIRQRISQLKKTASYRGWRHKHGQPVRGQNTQSSFRGKGAVGVVRAELQEEAAAEEEEE